MVNIKKPKYNFTVTTLTRHKVDNYTAAFPSLPEIPAKGNPYDPEKDSVLRRAMRLFGE